MRYLHHILVTGMLCLMGTLCIVPAHAQTITTPVVPAPAVQPAASGASSTASGRMGMGSLSLSSPADRMGLPTLGSNGQQFLNKNVLSNDDLINYLSQDGGIIRKVMTIAKYILAGVFIVLLGLHTMTLLTAHGEEAAITTFRKQIMYTVMGFGIIALAEPLAFAFQMGHAKDGGNFVTDPELLKKSISMAGFSIRAAAQLLQYLLGIFALFFMGLSAFRIVTAAGEEGKVKDARKTLVWATIGLIIAGATTTLVDLVIAPATDASGQGAVLVDLNQGCPVLNPATGIPKRDPKTQAPVMGTCTQLQLQQRLLATARVASRAMVLNYVKYFQTFVGGIAVMMMFLAGAKMVTAAGNEAIINQQKKMLIWIFMGLGIILFSEVFVDIFFPWNGNTIGVPGDAQIASFGSQMGGLTNFLLTFSGATAVLSLIVGALMLAGSGAKADLAQNAKKIIMGSVMGIVITISAYALVNTVFSGNAVTPNVSINATTP